VVNEILTEESFEDTINNSDRPVLVYFKAPWCSPCRLLSSTIDSLADHYAGDLFVMYVDVDVLTNVAADQNVQSIPMLILYDGGKALWRSVGVKSLKQLVIELDEQLTKKR
jgi:thioredoxin 1